MLHLIFKSWNPLCRLQAGGPRPGLVCRGGLFFLMAMAWVAGEVPATLRGAERAALVPSVAPEYSVKAGYLLRFPAYVEWPTGTFASAMDPVVIGVLGQNPFGEEPKKIPGDAKNNRRPVEIRVVKTLAEAEGCAVIFIPRNSDGVVLDWLELLRQRPVLTVTDSESGLAMGAVLAFVLEKNSVGETKVRFLVNQPAARAAGLQIGAELLRSAKKVVRDPVGAPMPRVTP